MPVYVTARTLLSDPTNHWLALVLIVVILGIALFTDTRPKGRTK